MNTKTPPPQPKYKDAKGYFGVMQDAKKLVQIVKERKETEKANLENSLELEAEQPQSRLSKMLSSVSPAFSATVSKPSVKRTLMWVARIILLYLIIWQGGMLWQELGQEDRPPSGMPDTLIPIDANAPDFDGVKNYANYIAGKVSAGGMDAIEGKWIDGIPPCFKTEAKAALAFLDSNFVIDKVSADKNIVYNVECHVPSNPQKTVSFEIVRKRIDSGRIIYRLQRVY